MKHIYLSLSLLFLVGACNSCGSSSNSKLLEKGVSLALANHRAQNISDVEYSLFFSLPKEREKQVDGQVEISFSAKKKSTLIIDFTGSQDQIKEVKLNGEPTEYSLINQHIVIEGREIKKGQNSLLISFVAGEQSLNRREEFMYTLLVPDRARTLFPCFDQPNIKGKFALRLNLPKEWAAIGNGKIIESRELQDGLKEVIFNSTKPISTYLFSFVAGLFEHLSQERNGRSVTLYHREKEPAKVEQCAIIFDQVFHSLDWMEQYTTIAYPFEKYDLVILPGFQYGGMEHMGATLYNDRRMFVEENATIEDQLSRSSLIAHETAHMWFGDYVTMRWFNDVWNKEVFANWFAAKIIEPMYPQINHKLNFILSYYPQAYSEDRTGGAMPIQQPLNNLKDAGLIYSNIVYCKSPIVMQMLVDKVGEENFREAIIQYLNSFSYGNADWDDLIEILDSRTTEDLKSWSNTWVKERGMPTVWQEKGNGSVEIKQSDPWGRELFWQESIAVSTANERCQRPLLNIDGKAYGYFKEERASLIESMEQWDKFNEIGRIALLINYHEAVMNLNLEPQIFIDFVAKKIPLETNAQIVIQALSYSERILTLFFRDNLEVAESYERALLTMAEQGTITKIPAIKSFCRIASTPNGVAKLYELWSNEKEAKRYQLSDGDLTSISYDLAIYMPHKADEIISTQLERIQNPDKKQEYQFISRAVSPLQQERDHFFESLLLAQNRAIEPWVILSLKLLNHPNRAKEAIKYIKPALDALTEIQESGDIFMPANWCAALFAGHTSKRALESVEEFLESNPNYPILLKSKIKLRADHLFIVNGELEKRYR